MNGIADHIGQVGCAIFGGLVPRRLAFSDLVKLTARWCTATIALVPPHDSAAPAERW
jgi:hypothetical protein